MRCKQHYTDLSSIVGVCASCLRLRLFSLIAAQSQSQTLEDKIRNSDTHPAFPRSVSPYITRRKSDHSVHSSTVYVPEHRFFSTPQVGPTANSYNFSNSMKKKKKKKQHSFIRFSLITNLFRSKKRSDYLDPDPNSDPRVSVSIRETATSAMSSPAWFRSGTNRKKQPVAGGDVTRKLNYPDRGMSPARYSDCGGAEDEYSGYESSESRKQTPWRTPAHPLGRRGGAGSVSGLNFCLSPLVRASPCRLWNQKGIPVEGGDMRSPVKPHLGSTKSFCGNRSRKLADFGRFDSNR